MQTTQTKSIRKKKKKLHNLQRESCKQKKKRTEGYGKWKWKFFVIFVQEFKQKGQEIKEEFWVPVEENGVVQLS